MKETIFSGPLSMKLTAARQSFGARTYELKKRGGVKGYQWIYTKHLQQLGELRGFAEVLRVLIRVL